MNEALKQLGYGENDRVLIIHARPGQRTDG